MNYKLILGLCLLLASVASAQMAESLREEFHNREEYGLVVVNQGELSRARGYIKDPTTRMLVVQVMADEMDVELARDLIEWVREGHTLWFYDARLAPYFGMKPYFLRREQFKNKDESGVLGEDKYDGVAAVALAHKSHPVVTGVGHATLFLPTLEMEEGKRYGSVEVEADTVPVLQFALDSPALIALRREGKGMIVYKCLLWPEVLSGDRLNSNLLEFSAGFGVPGPAGEGKLGRPPGPEADYVEGSPAVELPPPGQRFAARPLDPKSSPDRADGSVDRLHTESGEVVTGLVQEQEVRFETSQSSMTIPVAEVLTIQMGGAASLDQLETRDGRLLKGLLLTPEFKLKDDREETTWEKSALKKIEFRRNDES